LRRSTVVIFLFLLLATTEAFARTTITPYMVPPVDNRLTELKRLEAFPLNQFNPEVGLVRESPDGSIRPMYWLLSDNLPAS